MRQKDLMVGRVNGKGLGVERMRIVARRNSLRGIALSAEVLFAALLLFGIIIFASKLSAIIDNAPSSIDTLSLAAADAAQVGVELGAWQQAAGGVNDSIARNLLDSQSAGICMRAEILNYTLKPEGLAWAYAPQNCTGAIEGPSSHKLHPFVYRKNSTYQQFYWVRITTWPRA